MGQDGCQKAVLIVPGKRLMQGKFPIPPHGKGHASGADPHGGKEIAAGVQFRVGPEPPGFGPLVLIVILMKAKG